jgi:uncharacterized membrane protein YdbT with pleckstrin-like domain
MDLHPGERVVFEGHRSWRSVIGFYALGIVAVTALGVLVGIAAGTVPGVVVVVVGMPLVHIVGLLKGMETRYVVTTERLRIRRGLLAKRVQQTQLDRVQNVNTSQSLLERILAVGTVDFDTAGSDDSEFAFVGIADPEGVMAAVEAARREAAAAARHG